MERMIALASSGGSWAMSAHRKIHATGGIGFER
jgi:hypothetical protein